MGKRDFSRKTLRALAKKDIEIVGSVAVPAFEGDPYFSGVAYQLVQDDECSFIRSFADVLALAEA